MSSFDTTWDIEKYHYPHEIDRHWNLKKQFMIQNKSKYPENRLSSLAQMYYNIQFLGCTYSDSLMQLVDELSEGIEDEYAEEESVPSKQSSLYSNFVQGEALGPRETPFARHQGGYKGGSSSEGPIPSRWIPGNQLPPAWEPRAPSEFQRAGPGQPLPNPFRSDRKRPLSPPPQQDFPNKIKLDAGSIMDSGPFGKVVLFEASEREDHPNEIINRTAGASRMTTQFSFTSENNNLFLLDGLFLANGKGSTQKAAREDACRVAIRHLKETSFTVQVKAPFASSEQINRSLDSELNKNQAKIDQPICDSNIGSKMMKLMGWAGGGLGKNEQGIEEPIKPTDRSIQRTGLGIKNSQDFRKKAMDLLHNFASSSGNEDLVFSPEFTKEERKIIHDLVGRYNLKSRSYGKDEGNRHLVVFKRVTPREIVEDLLKCGGETEKYRLIPPSSARGFAISQQLK